MTPEQRAAEYTPLQLAVLFHDTYESLAPSFGYETRAETRTFDATTPNGRLMVAVCERILKTLDEHPADESEPVTVKEAFDMLGARASVVPVRNDDGSVTPYAWIGRHLKVDTKQKVNRLLAALEGK